MVTAALPAQRRPRRRKGDLVPNSEILRVLALARQEGLPIGAIDIRADGVTIHLPATTAGNAFDQWKNQSRDGSAHG